MHSTLAGFVDFQTEQYDRRQLPPFMSYNTFRSYFYTWVSKLKSPTELPKMCPICLLSPRIISCDGELVALIRSIGFRAVPCLWISDTAFVLFVDSNRCVLAALKILSLTVIIWILIRQGAPHQRQVLSRHTRHDVRRRRCRTE